MKTKVFIKKYTMVIALCVVFILFAVSWEDLINMFKS